MSEPTYAYRGKPVLTVGNTHYDGCGKPPNLVTGDGLYTCYFERFSGEQYVLQYDCKTKICRLWFADCGWDVELRVEEHQGHIIVREIPDKGGIMIDAYDMSFIKTFWESLKVRINKGYDKY